jgi:hypothetical protein
MSFCKVEENTNPSKSKQTSGKGEKERGKEGGTSIDIGAVDVPYLSMTFPFLSTRNLVKFHLILADPNKPSLLAFRNL